MKTSYNIGRIAGIDINIHITWLFVFALLSWSLSTEFFPSLYKFGVITNWVLGIVSAALLFVSVIVHELMHSIVSKRNKMEVESITLFFFGGVSNISPEELGPKTEFKIAIAGPVTSVLMGLAFFLLFKANTGAQLNAIFNYLYKVNLLLAGFNMIPGYPLDGGRVLRSVLWAYYKSIKKATRIASQAGTLFGWFLVFSGLISMFRGGFGLWYILLGGFLVFLAKAGYEQVIMKESLSRVKLQDLVTKTELCQPSQTIDTFMRRCEEQSLCYGLVRQKNRFFVIDLEQVARLPREAWNKARVRDIMRPVEALSAEQDPFKIFYIMRKENLKLVPIVRRGKYLGIVTEETIMNKMRVLSIRDSA